MSTKVYVSNSDDKARNVVETISASQTLSVGDSGKTFLVATDALTITLPPVGSLSASVEQAPAGTEYTFINSGADGNNTITLSPAAADAIFGSIANAAADSVSSGALNKDIVNTKATSNKGDRITIVSDGADGWYISNGVGIWASEA